MTGHRAFVGALLGAVAAAGCGSNGPNSSQPAPLHPRIAAAVSPPGTLTQASKPMRSNGKVMTRHGVRAYVPAAPPSDAGGVAPPTNAPSTTTPTGAAPPSVTRSANGSKGLVVVPQAAHAQASGVTTPPLSASCPPSSGGTTSTTTLDEDPYEATVNACVASFFATANANPGGPHVTGAAVAIVAKDPDGSGGPIIYEYPYGSTSATNEQPTTDQTQWEIGSETKTFTATALAQLVVEGKVNLNDQAQTYVPGSTTLPTSNAPCSGATSTTVTPATISLLNLATHTSGLQDTQPTPPAPLPPWNSDSEGRAGYDYADLWASFGGQALQSPPGCEWFYSDWGYGLLGTILADVYGPAVNGVPAYASLIGGLVTGPLGLQNTVLEPTITDPASAPPAMARPTCTGGGTNCYFDNNNAYAGAGGLISTIADMGNWAAVNVGYNQTTLASALSMTHQQWLSVPVYQSTPPSSQAMGLAWQIYDKSAVYPNPYMYKNGGTNGFHSFTFLVPEKGWAITVLTNGDDSTVGKPPAPVGEPQPPEPLNDLGKHLMQTLAPR